MPTATGWSCAPTGKLLDSPFREAILFRRSRIKRPKEALLKNLGERKSLRSRVKSEERGNKVRKGSGLDFQHGNMSKIKALTPSSIRITILRKVGEACLAPTNWGTRLPARHASPLRIGGLENPPYGGNGGQECPPSVLSSLFPLHSFLWSEAEVRKGSGLDFQHGNMSKIKA